MRMWLSANPCLRLLCVIVIQGPDYKISLLPFAVALLLAVSPGWNAEETLLRMVIFKPSPSAYMSEAVPTR